MIIAIMLFQSVVLNPPFAGPDATVWRKAECAAYSSTLGNRERRRDFPRSAIDEAIPLFEQSFDDGNFGDPSIISDQGPEFMAGYLIASSYSAALSNIYYRLNYGSDVDRESQEAVLAEIREQASELYTSKSCDELLN